MRLPLKLKFFFPELCKIFLDELLVLILCCKVSSRFVEFLNSITTFTKEKGKKYPELEN